MNIPCWWTCTMETDRDCQWPMLCAEHRSLTILLRLTLFCAIWASVCQLCPVLDISSSTDLRKVFLGISRLLYPLGILLRSRYVALNCLFDIEFMRIYFMYFIIKMRSIDYKNTSSMSLKVELTSFILLGQRGPNKLRCKVLSLCGEKGRMILVMQKCLWEVMRIWY